MSGALARAAAHATAHTTEPVADPVTEVPPGQATEQTGDAAGRPAGEEDFRAASRGWTSGVAVLTTRVDEEVFAKTVSSFTTLSLDPLLVTVAVGRHSPLVAAARASGRFALSVLTSHQEQIARRFATPGAGRALGAFGAAGPFAAVPTRTAATGAPLLDAALASFDCWLHTALPGGDHTILVGRVAAAARGAGTPLLHHDGRYRVLAPISLNPIGVGA
ncbi:flavin reductase family protein [Kitasatospora aureofaciens]|uniref:flavin reductase family protein n=1 Tax=Kitasatospora aureofaciens TaxID=1894 RepID=UPI0033FE20C3